MKVILSTNAYDVFIYWVISFLVVFNITVSWGVGGLIIRFHILSHCLRRGQKDFSLANLVREIFALNLLAFSTSIRSTKLQFCMLICGLVIAFLIFSIPIPPITSIKFDQDSLTLIKLSLVKTGGQTVIQEFNSSSWTFIYNICNSASISISCWFC